MSAPKKLKTWIEIDKSAIAHNVAVFKGILSKGAKLMAVVKSNAYGHGIMVFPRLADRSGVDGFCVDSVMEGEKLRSMGISKPILVLGFTLPDLFELAEKNDIAITISGKENLEALMKSKHKPKFHVKVDTGMRRQGFYAEDLEKRFAGTESTLGNYLKGVYTHFASAKDFENQDRVEEQFKKFQEAVKILEKSGFKNLIKHVAATGATLLGPQYHMDWARVGIGLYGLWPSPELESQFSSTIRLKPVLSWRTIVSETKAIKRGDQVGYDGVEVVKNDGNMAVLPVGYWHGMPRILSGTGSALLRGEKCKILGKISMDIIVVDAGKSGAKVGDIATLIGVDGGKEISAYEVAKSAGTVHYEIVTRLNPLIERVVV